MSREKMKNSRTRVNVWILSAVNRRLEKWCADYGWSKTKTVEMAVDMWVKERDKERREAARIREENLSLSKHVSSGSAAEGANGLAKARQ